MPMEIMRNLRLYIPALLINTNRNTPSFRDDSLHILFRAFEQVVRGADGRVSSKRHFSFRSKDIDSPLLTTTFTFMQEDDFREVEF